MPDGMHGSSADEGRITTVVKEVQRDDVTVTLEVPPLRVGKEAALRVGVHDRGSSAPVRDARVSIAFRPLQAGAASEPRPGSRAVVLLAEEGSSLGVYLATHTFEKLGTYEIVAEVHAGSESADHPPLVVTARQEVCVGTGTVSRRGHTPLFVLGALGMLVMMGAFMF
jgi:hypothetical protein